MGKARGQLSDGNGSTSWYYTSTNGAVSTSSSEIPRRIGVCRRHVLPLIQYVYEFNICNNSIDLMLLLVFLPNLVYALSLCHSSKLPDFSVTTLLIPDSQALTNSSTTASDKSCHEQVRFAVYSQP
jgi:hypothetical protein